MERQIQKFTGYVPVIGKSLLHFDFNKYGEPVIWVLSATPGEPEAKTFQVFPTGEMVDTTQWVHRQTIVNDAVGLVWHLFERV